MHVCMYAYMYLCTYVFMYICRYVVYIYYINIRMYVHTCVYICINYIRTYEYMSVSIRVCHHHKHPGLGHLARSVSRVTVALSIVSSVSQLCKYMYIYIYIQGATQKFLDELF
jgi:hypothetical protein